MNRRTLMLGAAAVAGVAGVGSALWRHRVTAPIGDAGLVWGLKFEQPSGAELVLANFRGKPLLLNFWATWCPPCVTEMPLLDRFQRQQRASGWQVVGLAIDKGEPVRQFLAKHPVGFAIGLAGPEGITLARTLGNTGGGLPFTVVFDRQGKLARTKLGAVHEDELADWVKSIA